MQTSLFLALLLGVVLIPVSLTMVAHSRSLIKTLESMLENTGLLYLAGILTLIGGTSIIYFHNIWTADWRVIITVFGWLMAVKGVLLIVAPDFMRVYSRAMLERRAIFPVAGVAYFVLGIFLISKLIA